jgi:hypothetical protein
MYIHIENNVQELKIVYIQYVQGLCQSSLSTLPPAVARQRAIQWASGLTYLSADSIAPVALWEVPTSLPRGDGCSDVETSREMDVAARACGWHWWCGVGVALAGWCGRRLVEGGAAAGHLADV